MAFTLLARAHGTVVASGDLAGTFVGTVDNGETPATLVGTVSRGLVEAFGADCIRTGFRIVLGGVEIPDADLVDYNLRESADSLVTFLDFSLFGVEYSVLATLKTWTLTTVELWTINGPPGAEREELRFTGYVMTGDQQSSGPGATVKVSCIDPLGRFAEFPLCHEIDPLSGLTRGEIVRELCADAGLTSVDVPPGAVYTRGVQAKGTRLGEFLRAFGEPEGWLFRWRPEPFDDNPAGGTLQAWTPTLKRAPLAADDSWDLSRCASFQLTPPRDVPSRWVVRGYGALYTDELGQTTKVHVTEVSGLYAPKVAINEQAAGTGAITPTGYSPYAATLRMVQRITNTTVSRGNKVLMQDALEEGWYNPRTAKQDTNGSSYDYVAAFIDEDGEYVQDWQERFRAVARNRFTYDYDADGNNVGGTEEVYRFYRRTMGVGPAGNSTVSVVGAYIYGDDNSYFLHSETFGLAEKHIVVRTYDEETGAEAAVTTQSFGYFSPRCAIGPGAILGHYHRADGYGQVDLVANWMQYAETENRNIVIEGTLAGTIELRSRYDTGRVLAGTGTYQWGEYDSYSSSQTLRLADIKSVQFNVLSAGPDGSFERITRETNQTPVREIVSGRVPQQRYMAGPWTYLAQQPIELIIDDPVAEELFGFRREVPQNDHIQSLEEAELVVSTRRRRALSYRITVARNETHNRVGSTVFLTHPDHALVHRALMFDSSSTRNRPKASQLGTYVFEVPL